MIRARRLRRARVVAVAATAALLGGGLAATAHADTDGLPVPTLRWSDCGDGLQCATAAVPLDYARPHGATISLALAKRPAIDQRHRIGSLFVNPGGPGGSGVQIMRQNGVQLVSEQVRERFDLIGFDPRGVGDSAPVRCFATQEEEIKLLGGVPSFPLDDAQNTALSKAAATLSAECGKRNGEILRRVTTANAARDLDLLRAAVGDQKTTFYGLSYGTYYAAVYANMFPRRVRAVIADGVVDPTQWSGDQRSFWYRTSAVGAERALDAFAADCAAAVLRCAYTARDGHATRARIDALLAKVREHPVRLPGTPARTVDYQHLVDGILAGLYQPSQWRDLASTLAALESLANGGPATVTPHFAPPPRYENSVDASYAVMCTDGVLARDPGQWPRLLGDADRAAPVFGRARLYVTLPCATWPATSPDRYTGPFNRRTASPVLVIGNTYDPATPLSGAEKLASLLPNSRLLTLNGYGHTALLSEPSVCVTDAITTYLLAGKVPAKGTVCQPDRDPFDPAATTPAAQLPIGPLR